MMDCFFLSLVMIEIVLVHTARLCMLSCHLWIIHASCLNVVQGGSLGWIKSGQHFFWISLHSGHL